MLKGRKKSPSAFRPHVRAVFGKVKRALYRRDARLMTCIESTYAGAGNEVQEGAPATLRSGSARYN